MDIFCDNFKATRIKKEQPPEKRPRDSDDDDDDEPLSARFELNLHCSHLQRILHINFIEAL